ncbi:MAG: MoaD/ThiS family protein [Desulfobulbaceae bacterium]|nr:MoaD/ThiS family protein [Desulfobulbaceae bacterium]
MRVKVKLFANFRINRFKQEIREYNSTMTVGAIVEELGIPDSEVGIIFINGRGTSMDQVLREGDTLSLFPLVGGG